MCAATATAAAAAKDAQSAQDMLAYVSNIAYLISIVFAVLGTFALAFMVEWCIRASISLAAIRKAGIPILSIGWKTLLSLFQGEPADLFNSLTVDLKKGDNDCGLTGWLTPVGKVRPACPARPAAPCRPDRHRPPLRGDRFFSSFTTKRCWSRSSWPTKPASPRCARPRPLSLHLSLSLTRTRRSLHGPGAPHTPLLLSLFVSPGGLFIGRSRVANVPSHRRALNPSLLLSFRRCILARLETPPGLASRHLNLLPSPTHPSTTRSASSSTSERRS